MGRHTHPDDIDDEAAAEAEAEVVRPKTSAVADLHLILRSPRLFAACIAVVVVPFLCYFAVMIGLDKMYDWALFIGAPMVLAGILVGALLDRAYGRLEHGRLEHDRLEHDRSTQLEAAVATEPATASVGSVQSIAE